MKYDFTVAKELCKAHGLVFDETLAGMADKAFDEVALTKMQANAMMKLWVRVMCCAFSRHSFSFGQRLLIALYWLGLGRSLKRW